MPAAKLFKVVSDEQPNRDIVSGCLYAANLIEIV